MATDWLSQYNSNLDIRDHRESLHKPYIQAYTSLADRTSTSSLPATPSPGPTTLPSHLTRHPSSPKPDSSPADLTTLRHQLATANTARTTLTTQLTSLRQQLTSLQTSHTSLQTAHSSLQSTHSLLLRRSKDLDHELREKSKLILSVQDEMLALELALNVAEEKTRMAEEKVRGMEREVREVRGENESLVKRWVERVGWESREAGMGDGRGGT
ncbi:hypothetical protein KVT40_001051 [Elsinoe batatas]|uniref:Autophagy-related protein 16 domain-containing protein n=1 Tax=Elsinoe batatas TaxID=2601811 RepID=A0A8K0LCE0_9PEZI|nr:hypothetical protein KVT40_001051 [Elsinoe batatas]